MRGRSGYPTEFLCGKVCFPLSSGAGQAGSIPLSSCVRQVGLSH